MKISHSLGRTIFYFPCLKSSKSGLLNLKETYSYDIKFCCEIDVLLEMVEAKLIELDNMFGLCLTDDSDILLPPPKYISSDKDENF